MRVFSRLYRLGLHALALISPPACPVCGKPLSRHALSILCPACKPSLAAQPRCLRCGRILQNLAGLSGHAVLHCRFCRPLHPKFTRAISIGTYQGRWREAVLKFKSRPQGDFNRQLAHQLVRLVGIHLGWEKIHGLVPVPARVNPETHPARRLAEIMAQLSGRPCYPILHFMKKTVPQRGLTRKERLKNMKQVLKTRLPVPAPVLLLVDDVMTTGATLQECARALKKAGAHHVYAALLAHGALE